MKDSVFIFDPYTEGHHDFYNNLLIEALLEEKYNIFLLTTKAAIKMDSYERWKKLSSNLHIKFLKKKSVNGHAMPWQFQQIHDLIHKLNPIHIYMPILDLMVLPLLYWFIKNKGSCFNVKWSTIYFRPCLHYKYFNVRSDYIQNPIKKISSAIKFAIIKLITRDHKLVNIHVVDEYSVDYYNKLVKRSVFKHFPDPVLDSYFDRNYDKFNLRLKSGFQKDDFIYLAYGFHNHKKGTDILLKAFRLLKNEKIFNDAKLAIIGPITDNKVIKLLKNDDFRKLSKSGDLIVVNRHLDQEDSLLYFRISDCICVPYRNHISGSGVLIRAFVMNKKIISSNQNWMALFVREKQLGSTCKQNDTESLYQAMKIEYRKVCKLESEDSDYYRSQNFQNNLINDLSL